MNPKELYSELQKIDNIDPSLKLISMVSNNSEDYFDKSCVDLVETVKNIKNKKGHITDVVNFLKGVVMKAD